VTRAIGVDVRPNICLTNYKIIIVA
jgi:hypothetical protein